MNIRQVEAVATEIRHASGQQLSSRSTSIVSMLLGVINDLRAHCDTLKANASSHADVNGERSLRAIDDRLSNLHSLVESMLQDSTLSAEELRGRLNTAASAVLSVQRAHETMFGKRSS